VQVQEICGLLDRLESLSSKAESQRMKAFKSLVQSNQHTAIMEKLLLESELVLKSGSDLDILNYFAIYCSLILKAKKGAMMLEIANNIQSNTKDKTKVRLQLLVDLYNLEQDLGRRYSLLLGLLKYASATNQTDSIAPQFCCVDEWEKELHLPLEKTRELCLSILSQLTSKSQSTGLLVKYLRTFDKEIEQAIESEFTTIEKLVLDTLKTADLYHIDLLNLKAIETFKGRPFHTLVQVVSTGVCREFKDQFSGSYLSKEDYEILLEKLRILTMTTLFAAKDTVSFSEVAAALDIAEDDVEAWVVDVAAKDLVIVRIDQPQRLINVSYSAKRNFETKDWSALGERVGQLRENLASFLETVRRAKASTGNK
jgi:translation initiation factor 3 subunit M